MFFSLNLLEILPLIVINIFFILIFYSVLILSYPTGRLILFNYCDNSIIKNSIFSISIFATLVSITLNLSPILAKYLIFVFYLLNLLILLYIKKVRKDLIESIILFKPILILTFVIFFIFNLLNNPIHIENNNLIFLFDSHYTYNTDPISEIFNSDYFTRLKISSVYPFEWAKYHFFQASFNSFFLFLIHESGVLGLISLKIFYISIFLSLFIFNFFEKISQKNEQYFVIFFKILLIILIFIALFSPKIFWLIMGNGFICAISLIFLIQSIFSKKKKDFIIWTIILSLGSFKAGLVSLMFIFYYLTETKNIILKIKKNINFPNLILSILFIFYFLVTFLQGEILISKFHLLDDEYTWWSITTINSLIINYKFFLISLMSLIFFLSLYKKKYMRKYMLSLYLKKINFYDLFLLILIPIVCVFFLILKGQNIEFFNIEKLKIFFLSFKLSNLFYYFLIPAAWYLIFFFQSFKIRYIFLTTIVTYTFFSIFINNAIVLPGIYILEIALLYFILYELVNSREKYLSYILIGSLVITVLFNFTNYNYKSIFQYRTGTKLIFKVEDLKYLKKNKYLCPADIIKINNHNLYGSALSGILAKPYYAEFSFKDRYSNWHIISKRWAAKPRDESKNLCNEK